MTNRDAARVILADAQASAVERHGALILLAGAETPKAQDEILIMEWKHRRAA